MYCITYWLQHKSKMLGLLKMCYTCLEMNSKDLTDVSKTDYDSLTYLYKLKACISLELVRKLK